MAVGHRVRVPDRVAETGNDVRDRARGDPDRRSVARVAVEAVVAAVEIERTKAETDGPEDIKSPDEHSG